MPTTAERRLRQALADLIRAARKAGSDDALELATEKATRILDDCRTVVPVREPVGRRRVIGEHTSCKGTMYEVQQGLVWVLWCDRCGSIPRRWRVLRRVSPEPEVCCRDCLCYVAERQDCPAIGRHRAPSDPPFLKDCFIPLAE